MGPYSGIMFIRLKLYKNHFFTLRLSAFTMDHNDSEANEVNFGCWRKRLHAYDSLDKQPYRLLILGCMWDKDAIFKALSDSTRRLILDELSERNELTLYELNGTSHYEARTLPFRDKG